MSAETFAALEAALTAHLADEMPDCYLSGWVTYVAAADLDQHTAYRAVLPETQPFHVSDGLTNVGMRLIDETWEDAD